jgi:hypothetical protein
MSDDDTSTKKYHQIVVPDHSLKPGTGGTSFLRTGTFPSLTDATKQPPGFQKSLALAEMAGDHHLKTGGSWHHVDGNRVETTTGRKVEVIAGSYVAHRGPGNSPGANFSSTWATNSYTQIGSKDLPIGWNPNVNPAVAPNTTNVDPDHGFADTLSFGYDGSRMGADAASRIEVNPTNPTNSNMALQSGDVAAVTWAQRIMTYVGSPSAQVPLVYAETYAAAFHSYSYFTAESKVYVGSDANPVPTVIAQTDAGSIDTRSFAHSGDITTWNHAVSGSGAVWQDTVAVGILTTNEAKADISVFNTSPLLTTVNTGIQAVVNVGAVGTFTFGPNLVMNLPSFWNFTLDETGFKLASADMTAAQQRLDVLKTQLANMAQDVTSVSNTIAGTHTSLAATRTHLGAVRTYLNALHNLGP